jgi:hypothetical protein
MVLVTPAYSTVLPENWCHEEFASLELGDPRLRKRFLQTAAALGRQPLSSINQACETWAATKGAYRLFANDAVQAADILAAHRTQTVQRLAQGALMFAIQDTTYCTYTSHAKTVGIGHIGTAHGVHAQGLILHTTLTVNRHGVPMGILQQEISARAPRPRKRTPKTTHKKQRIEDKESGRWLRALEQTAAVAPPGTQLVTLADRESDIYEFLARAEALTAPFVIRAATDRTIQCDDEVRHLWEYVTAQRICARMTVEVSARPHEPARTATVGVTFASVQLCKPKTRTAAIGGTTLPAVVAVKAVFVTELDPPPDVTPLEWMLLTNVPVTSPAEALERVHWYRLRWSIESFHRILKSGCAVEQCRLSTAARLTRYLTLSSIIAWKLFWLTQVGRQQPETPCDQLLTTAEWQALYCKHHKTHRPPRHPPTTADAMRWIAQLGGFLARTHDKDPGPMTLWRGWQRMADITEDWLLFQRRKTCG